MQLPTHSAILTSIAVLLYGSTAAADSDQTTLPEIVVTAELIEADVLELPGSMSVVTSELIQRHTARHIEDLLNFTPNVNFASGASRGRFLQIRGIGERSEFQEPVNYSVGVLVDGIDLTGISTAANTLDVYQVEVLRGPQGTLFGANALAGMINIVSNRPTDEFEAELTGAAEEFGGQEWRGTISGPLAEHTTARFALQNYQSDGFVDNVFLNRDDTNRIDETSAKLRVSSDWGERFESTLSVLYADIDNGYDAFSLDNTRETYSDQPGRDQQETLAASLQLNYQLTDTLRLETLLSRAKSKLLYSYDEDWSHPGICDNTECDSELWGFDWFYSSTDTYQRTNANSTIDVRLLSLDTGVMNWVAGLYHRQQSVDLQRQYTFADSDFRSALSSDNSAVYGQLDLQLHAQWSLSIGLRGEQRSVDYQDNGGNNASPDETLWGGRLAVEHHADSGALYYGLLSRGYKTGGFNLAADIPGALREYGTESMLNYELGLKHTLFNERLRYQLALFYQDRNDIQSKQSIVRSIDTGLEGDDCPCSFTDYTANATSGRNLGLELEAHWQASDNLDLFAAVGLLDTEFDEFLTFEHILADRENGIPYNLKGRAQAHAPDYHWTLGGNWKFAQRWRLSGNLAGKDAFYFSDRHDELSDAITVLDLQLSYDSESWGLGVYAKNLTDETIKTRGFGSFGNDPRKLYVVEPYNQFGSPRVLGIKARLTF